MSTHCPYCSSQSIHVQWRKAGFWTCDSCGLFFRNPPPTPQELDAYYAGAWSDTETHRAGTGGTDERLAGVYARALARDLDRRDLARLQILDFGAGRGDFARALQSSGADVTCLEPFGFEYLQKQGFTVHRDFADLPAGLLFDGIVMVDVWEHLDAPWETLKTCAARLREGGWLFVATPNPNGLSASLRGSRWREARKLGHLFFGGPRTLERMHKDAGFAVWKRLKWNIRYSANPAVAAYQSVLQRTGLDGELRSLAWKA